VQGATSANKAPATLATIPNVLGIVALLLVLAILTGAAGSLPLLASDQVAFYALVVIGIAMCVVGGLGQVPATLGWTHPITLAGTALGVLALVPAAAVLNGRADVLRPIGSAIYGDTGASVSGERVALIVLAVIMAAKWALGLGRSLVRSSGAR
jgi:hypothetical protein